MGLAGARAPRPVMAGFPFIYLNSTFAVATASLSSLVIATTRAVVLLRLSVISAALLGTPSLPPGGEIWLSAVHDGQGI